MKTLKVAVVGAGPAGMYSIEQFLHQAGGDVQIDLFERLATPWGLIRAGVAPDHPEKKQIVDRLFQFNLKDEAVRFFGNVEIGTDISHDELSANYHAVIYAVGAEDDKSLGIPGEELDGSWSARQFVAWYNGHPDYSRLQFDFSSPRAVIVGTGNVALDVARILLLRDSALAKTDIADHALAALSASHVKEVVVLGRRGCQQAAFHNPELEELLELNDVEVAVEANDLLSPEHERDDPDSRRKMDTLVRLQNRSVGAPRKRLVFKFHRAPVAVRGKERVGGLDVRVNDSSDTVETIPCGLVLRAIGYRGKPLAGLPFDSSAGIVPHAAGRVIDGSDARTGVYVTGWIKRGPRGVIGSNKKCAAETVSSLLTDARAGKLTADNSTDVARLLADRNRQVVSYQGWQRIDLIERQTGHLAGRPRVKQTVRQQLLASAAQPIVASHGEEE
jgi:NADPH-dependent glutamate synthase beta subunit-like oxidoreductase